MSGRLDAIDWKILKEMQDDGRISNVELARRVGISGTDRENVCAKQGQLLAWPRARAPYPGGIDDLPI